MNLNKLMNPERRNDFNTMSLNNRTYIDYFDRLKMLAVSMFEWENLPETMNSRFLELTLFDYGIACFVFDDNLGFLNLKCTPSAELNVYEEAIKYTAYSLNYNKIYNRDDIILVRNNLLQLPTFRTIELFANRLYEAERTINVNIKTQKTPVLIKCNEKQRLTLKNVYKNYEGNEPVIFGDKDLDISNFEVLKTDAPFIADKMIEYKKSVWNECLSFLGVNNLETEKKERLIVDEVNANNQMIQLSAETMLLTRQEACKEFNKKYGLNISVNLRNYDDFKNHLNLIQSDESDETEVEYIE